MNRPPQTKKLICRILIWIIGLTAVLLSALLIFLRSPLPARIVNSLDLDRMQVEISVERLDIQPLKNFPNVRIRAEKLKARYKDELYVNDTISVSDASAEAKSIDAEINIFTLAGGNVKIPEIIVDSLNMDALVSIKDLGEIRLPVLAALEASACKDSIRIRDMKATVAGVPLEADAMLHMHDDSTYVKGKAMVNGCRMEGTLDIIREFFPFLKRIRTDAEMWLEAELDGHYIHSTGELPDFRVDMNMPDAEVAFTKVGKGITLGLNASACHRSGGLIDMNVSRMEVKSNGLYFKGNATASDILGTDPDLEIKGDLKTVMDSLSLYIPEEYGIHAMGQLTADMSAKIRMSQLNMKGFSQADLIKAHITGSDIFLKSKADSLNGEIGNVELYIGTADQKNRVDSTQNTKFIGIDVKADKASLRYKDSMAFDGTSLSLSAKNSADLFTEGDTSKVYPFSGRLHAEEISIIDSKNSQMSIRGSSNSFVIHPKRGNTMIPVLRLKSSNERVFLRGDEGRVSLTNASINAMAAMNSIERRIKAKSFIDSLGTAHPDVPKDSLFTYLRSQRKSIPVPEWLTEEDFIKQDIDIRLDESLAKYFREWDLNGSILLDKGLLMSPHFPLRNSIRDFSANFTNDRVSIDSMKLSSGMSNMEIRGEVSGLRRSLLGRGHMKLDMDVTSDYVDANELMTAYAAGAIYAPEGSEAGHKISDADYLNMIAKDTLNLSAIEDSPLIVVPANLNASISIDASNIEYSDIEINSMKSELAMKERCIQITKTSAATNIGDVNFEGFYSTRTKKDIKGGFNMNFENITAEKVIDMMPATDTLIPMLKSFKGLLSCEIAATASIDTNMNIISPSINGIMRIKGKDMSISENSDFSKIAKKLKFKDSRKGTIDKISVEGIIKDNMVEVFPFLVEIDRYKLAMSGIHRLDNSYKYHVSVINSPLVIRIGVDIYGPDFERMKFKIGKPKYKNSSIPVFTSVIDTTRISLISSIRNIFEKGVEAAISENQELGGIQDFKEKIDYVQVVDQDIEELTEDEQNILNEETTQ